MPSIKRPTWRNSGEGVCPKKTKKASDETLERKGLKRPVKATPAGVTED